MLSKNNYEYCVVLRLLKVLSQCVVEDVNDRVQERRLTGDSKKDEEEVVVGGLISLVWLYVAG